MDSVTRRTFLAASTAAFGKAEVRARSPLCIFSKHMARFNYNELGKHARALGFDGVDLTVRDGGHVLPARAAEDLPRAYDALLKHEIDVPMITTGLTSASDPTARPILSTASRLKIPVWKPGYFRYRDTHVEEDLEKAKTAASGLARLSQEYRIAAGFHNHSGDYVGSAVWDIRAVIHDLDPQWIGYYFDPGHARAEGGLAGWKISQEIASKRLKMVAVKDFYWAKSGGAWQMQWCPLGEGMVDWGQVFTSLKLSHFTGPITLHLEYHAADELAAIAKDLEYLKKLIYK